VVGSRGRQPDAGRLAVGQEPVEHGQGDRALGTVGQHQVLGLVGRPALGVELDAIAAVVIGGTLLTGGSGYVFGTLVGVMIMGLIQTYISFHGSLNSWWTKIVIGVLLLFFIALQKALTSLRRS
jgi:predicted ABC-type sugar transport system permease subunit